MMKSNTLALMFLAVLGAVAQTKQGFIKAADSIQRLMDADPNRTLWFADGTYLLFKPTCTSAAPRRSVDLQFSAYYKTQDLKCKGF